MHSLKIFLLLLLSLWLLFFPARAVDPDSRWQYFDAEAERQSRIASGRKGESILSLDSAIALNSKALTAAFETHSLNDSNAAWLSLHRGDYYFQSGRTVIADSIWHAAAASLYDPLSLEPLMLRLGIAALALSESPRDSLGIRARDAVSRIKNSPKPSQAATLFALGFLYDKLDRSLQAESCIVRLIQLCRQDSTSNPLFAIRTLLHLAENQSKILYSNYQRNSRAQDSAIALGSEALKMAEHAYGPRDTIVAFVLNRLGDYYARQGLSRVADSLWARALEINQAKLPEENIEVQGSISRMGGVYASVGRYTEAETLLKRAVSLRIQTQGAYHPEVASMMTALGRFLVNAGRYEEAENCFEGALQIRRKSLAPDHSDIAISLIDLGRLQSLRAHFAAAEHFYLEALDIRRQVLGKGHALTADCLELLGDLYEIWSRPNEALASFQEALAIRKSFLAPYHPNIANSLAQIAQLQSSLGLFRAANQNLQVAMKIVDSSVGRNSLTHWELLASFGENLARSHFDRRAESVLVEAWQGLNLNISADTLSKIAALTNLVNFHVGGNTPAALRYRDQLDELLSADSSSLPVVAEGCTTLARYYWQNEHLEEARHWAHRAFGALSSIFWDGSEIMCERDLLLYNDRLRNCRDLLLSICTSFGTPSDEVVQEIASVSLSAKTSVLDAIAQRHQLLAQSRYSPVTQLATDSLRLVQHELSSLYYRMLRPDPVDPIMEAQYLQLTRTKNKVESALATQASMEYGIETPKTFTADSLAEILGADQVLINYLKFAREDSYGKPTDWYLAVVVRPFQKPAVIMLGPASGIDSSVNECRRQLYSLAHEGRVAGPDDRKGYWREASKLAAMIWQPISRHAPDSAVILISPDDQLDLFSFSGLPVDKDVYLVERHAVGYVSNPRSLLTKGAVHPGIGLLVCGDVDYDASTGLQAPNDYQVNNSISAGSTLALRSLRELCDSSITTSVAPLPGSATEIKSAELGWRKETSEPVTVLRRAFANEEAFRTQAPGKRVIHVATHGFYLSPDCASANKFSQGIASVTVGDNPLLLSGLLLAGANKRCDSSTNGSSDDGILTAEEIVNLDLTGTDCIILSGCETGTGLAKTGGGLYGLSRAFQVAGAKFVVSSLWPVTDESSVRLMSHLYSTIGDNFIQPLRHAQLEILRDLRARKQPDHPFTWAPFVVTQ